MSHLRTLTAGRSAITAVLTWALLGAGAAWAQDRAPCPGGLPGAPSAFIDSSSSEVVVLTPQGQRLDAARDLLLCPGDEVLTGGTGRVSIRFDEKRTVIRLDGNSRTRILSGGTGDSDVSLLSGVLYFVSSVRQHFEVDTPYIVAGIDGTEALVHVQTRRKLAIAAVREGVVSAYDHEGPQERVLKVGAGEAAFRSATVSFQKAPISELGPPFRELLVVSDSAVDWAVYYPPILLAGNARDPSVRQAVILLSSGDYDRAEKLLGGNASAAAASLRTIIAVGRNRLAEAEEWSTAALRAGPDFAPAHIAASYFRQATGDLEGALEFAGNAVELAPHDAYAAARLAELHMTLGDRRAALEAANRALRIERTPLALFVAGLAHLAAWHYGIAQDHFREAIALDPEAPLPRLGLGLAFIRQGKIAEGTWELERAAALDPRRASLRNWLGRGYFAEFLPAKAAEQFKIAKTEDPEDPNSYLFAALERFSANQPVSALKELQEAEKHGDARRVVRSQAGLSEDAATRGAATGRIYDVLGFDQLAISEGTEAVETAPANPGAHRFLADAYRARPGYEIAQTSEVLVSQLLSPPSSTPVQPALAEADLALLDTTGPARVTFAEFAPLFDSDGLGFTLSGLGGTQNTWGDEVSATGLYRNASISLGQMHYETHGYRANNDLRHDIFNAVSTVALSPEFSLFGEYRHRETKGGDRPIDFNINDVDLTVRSQFEREVARIGFHAQPNIQSDLIGVYTWANLASRDAQGAGDELTNGTATDNSRSAQLQNIWQGNNLRNITGGSFVGNDIDLFVEAGGFPLIDEAFNTSYWSAYSYFSIDAPRHVTWTLGAAAVKYKEDQLDGVDTVKLLPKFGVRAEISDSLAVRASYLRNLKPDLVSEQILEPASVAGFNQHYDAINGSVFDQVGGAIDLSFGENVKLGGEAIARWWQVPVGSGPDGETEEQVYRGYLGVLLPRNFALAVEIVHEQSEAVAVPNDFERWRTASVPVTLSYFDESGWFGSAGIEFVDHSFRDVAFGGSDRFSLVSAAAGYRLPLNRGVISVEAQNLLDEEIQFQNRTLRYDLTAPPRFAPELTFLARATFNF